MDIMAETVGGGLPHSGPVLADAANRDQVLLETLRNNFHLAPADAE